MKFSNTITTVLKIYQKYVKNSVWFGKRVSSLLFFLLGLTSSFIAARAFAAGGVFGFFRAVTLQRKIRDCSQPKSTVTGTVTNDFTVLTDSSKPNNDRMTGQQRI